MKVLITGGSGLLGYRITSLLLKENVPVVHLTRSKNSKAGVKTYEWDWEKGIIDKNCLDGVTHIIHLAGSGIADKPWTMNRKRNIIKSRVETTRLLSKTIAEENHKLEAYISASGVGYYGAITNDKIYKEEDSSGSDFLAKCCVYWEEAADLFENRARVLKFRIGLILDKNSGALPKMANTTKSGFGAPLGTGNQFVPWIHLDDIANVFIHGLKNDISGVYNAVASQHITNRDLTYAIAKALHKKIRIKRIPKFILKGVYGELADLLLEGSRVDNKKLIESGFSLEYDNIESALESIYQ